MKYILILFLGLSTILGNAQRSSKRQAKSFALAYVKTYFEKDCTSNYTYLDDELIDLRNGKFLKTRTLQKEICKDIKKAVRIDTNFETYLKSYQIRILNPKQYLRTITKLPKGITFTKHDYFFWGSIPKKHLKQSFIWEEAFFFMVRKTSNGWKVKAFL
ncbi:hypothetical protein [Aquimarina rhabdastrellae]